MVFMMINKRGAAGSWSFAKIAALLLGLALVVWAIFFSKGMADTIKTTLGSFFNFFK